jgi:hypothetical protein
MTGYGQRSRSPWIILGSFCAYAGVLEFLQHFSARRSPLGDFAASAMEALAGTLIMVLLRLRYARLLLR